MSERTPLLGNTPTSNTNENANARLLLACYAITGFLDSSAVSLLGSFASMQTGNTVYLGLGLAGLETTATSPSPRWIKAGISIAGFCTGSFCFAQLHRRHSGQRGSLVSLSFLLQTVCLILAACILQTHAVQHDTKNDTSWQLYVSLALVSFQSAGQAVLSRVLECTSLTSVVLTSIYCDLFMNLPGLNHLQQGRRAGAIISLLLGTVLGGIFVRSGGSFLTVLWVVSMIKVCIAVIILCINRA
ncbi:hypothetical protein ASPZODRAFT_133799 [Penicilliopsis zonata CBS 506.65]|uniref:DUF1275 domain protein n=1 Tax=Penicilliopsis zonata CBS 506.65 TaxID=1073090 RepID=A0A1L9SFF8_9EURO|nr:hypothetical protein ASPZODRAFT_133799 [Penicilliopsis zonata CBS 506.65]OJJ45931.1 hypothetical protein ASPZODRAFT_133799 [Penicilliopsis zonata CBS 506.65]